MHHRNVSCPVLALGLSLSFAGMTLAATPVDWTQLSEVTPGATAVSFSPDLDRLEGQRVSLAGFMVPLEAKAAQTRFLLTQTPQDCEFCLEGGPESYVEVHSEPLAYSMKPVVMEGTLVLLRSDPAGMYYRMLDARTQP